MITFEGPTTFSVAAAPSRACYLIKAGSSAGFRRAVQEASTRWGGMTEPIIPVRKGGRIDGLWQQIVKVANVDGVVNVDVDGSDAKSAGERLGLPVIELRWIDRWSAVHWTCHPSALPPVVTNNFPVTAAHDARLWAVTLAGDVTAEHEAAAQEASVFFRREMQDDQLARAALRGDTLLDQSVSAFGHWRSDGGPWQTPAIVWVTKPSSLTDCLWFWNLRTLRSFLSNGAPWILLPAGQVQHWLQFDAMLRHRLDRRAEFSPDVVMLGLSVGDDQLHETAHVLGLELSRAEMRIGHHPGAPTRTSPFTYLTGETVDPVPWFLFRRRYGVVGQAPAYVHRGEVTIRATSPVGWTGGGATTLTFYGPAVDAMPKRDVVATLWHQHLNWHDDGLRLSTLTANEFNFTFKVPSLTSATSAVIASVTHAHKTSDKGRIGAALSDRATDLLAQGVYEAAIALMTPRSRDLLEELKSLRQAGDIDERIADLASAWGARTQRRYRRASDLGNPTGKPAVVALERLVAMGWGERGYELNCDQCGLHSFVPLSQTTADARCPACESRQQYTLERRGPETFYRLNALVDRAADQGVLPHLLVLGALEQENEYTALLLGTDVTFDDGGKPSEIDVFGVHGGKVLAGEVKTNPTKFTTDQVVRDVALSARLGADIHLMAAVGVLDDSQRSAAKREADRVGLELLILDRSALRPVR